nr:uncharacterized protein LOC123760273 [Procambarus clarkii]
MDSSHFWDKLSKMEDAELKNFIENFCVKVKDEEGLITYEINTEVIHKDEDGKIQVMSIGPVNEGPIKSVLLLGETGAGKTRVLNTMINHLLGVNFDDNFRFQLKDYVESDDLLQVESQTTYITAYIVSHQLGMPIECNYMLIDTPGFGDTRMNHDKVPIERLTIFLTNDCGIDDLNCVAIVAKANQNRITSYQKQMLEDFTSVLGSYIGDITQLLATFATDDNSAVVDVVKHAGVQFVNLYQFDNGLLYDPLCDGLLQNHRHAYLTYRWNRMQAEYKIFFEELQRSIPVNLKRTGDLLLEEKLLEETKTELIKTVASMVHITNSNNNKHREIEKIKAQADRIKVTKKIMVKFKSSVIIGYHFLNCDICRQTCKKCEDPKNFLAGFAGTGTGVGTAVFTGIGTSVTSGAVMGAEVGIFGGPIGVAIGAGIGTVLGLTAGLTTGLLMRKTKADCLNNMNGPCSSRECSHDMMGHKTETQEYVTEEKEIIDDIEKAKYDAFMNTITQLKTKVTDNNIAMADLRKDMQDIAKALLQHTNKIVELSLGHKSLNTKSVIDEIILNERENWQHVELLQEFRRTVMLIQAQELSDAGVDVNIIGQDIDSDSSVVGIDAIDM